MGHRNGPYTADFPKGSHVRIAERARLEVFMRDWHLHNPLQPEQLEYGGRTAVVANVGYYHGGDELYTLEGVPGIWHESCLESAVG